MKRVFILAAAICFVLQGSAQFSSNNKAVHFSNAADEGISVPYNNAMTFGATQDFTLESWIKTADAGSVMLVFAHQYCPGPSTGTLFFVAAGKMNFNIQDFNFNSITVTSNCSVADNKWHHVAGVRNVTTDSIYVYIDGVLQGQAKDNTVSGISNTSATNWIGRRAACPGTNNFYGDLDELRVWSKAKSAAELLSQKDAELVGNETNLIAYYNFNIAINGNGQTVINNCTTTGAVLNATILGNAIEPSFNTAQLQSQFVPCDPVLWLKADAGVYTDAGITAATNGQTVQQWNDQSGNNKHATQAIAANRPTLITNALNGKPLLRFSTASGFNQLVVPAIDLSSVNKTDLFIVYKISSGNVFFENSADLNVNTTGFAMYDNPQAGSGASVTLRGDAGYNTIYSYKDCDRYILSEGSFDKSLPADEVNVRVNGVLNPAPVVQPFNSNNSNNFGNNVSYIGYRGAGSVNGALPINGDIAEIILFSRVLTAEERTGIQNYLINKYDLNNPGNTVCGPVLWLKADAGVYTDAGITPATNGQPVQQWNDQSGNGNDVTQTNNPNKPVFITQDASAAPALYFDGANGNMFLNNTTSNLVSSGSARTVFVAARRNCSAHGSGVLGGTLFTFRRGGLINTLTYGANSYGAPVYIYSDNNGVGNNNAAVNGSAIDSAFSPVVITYKVPAAGGQLQCNINGISQTVNQGSGSVTAETGSTGFTVGDREDQVDLDWTGWIYEVIVYNRTLTGTEIAQVEAYLRNKYALSSSSAFSALPSTQTSSNSLQDDGVWKHSYNSSDNTKLVASVKDFCLDLGTRTDVVYTDATAGLYGGTYYMRRHYVVKPLLNPAGTKRVRLYYTNADFADLQSYVPALTDASQLVVTKYSGPDEDGVYNPAGGTVTYIPSSQITTGTIFGSNYLEFDVTGFSEFWIHTGYGALPLRFTGFYALKKENAVELSWKTENEINVSHFIVERSTEGRTFLPVATVAARNAAANNYSYTDALTQGNGKVYYRLKEVDANGSYMMSAVVFVLLQKDGTIAVYPNPAAETVYFSGWNNMQYLQLYDMSGRLTMQTQKTVSELDVSGVATGVYILKVVLKNGACTEQKIVIQH